VPFVQALEVVEQRRREEAQWAKEQQQRHAQDDAEQTARALAAIASAEAAEEERRCSQKQEKEEQPSLQGQASVMGVASAVGDTGATVPLSANPRTHASTQFSNLDTAKTNAWPDREQQQEHQVQQQQQQQQQKQHAHTSSLQVAPDSSFPAAVSQPRFCHQCGGGLLAGSKFCSSCGAQVVLAVAPPPPPLSPSVISPPLMQRHLPTSPSSTVATAATGGGRAYATQLSLRAFLSDDTMLTGGASSSNANHMDASLSSPLAFLSLGELPVENNSLGGVGSGALGGMAPAALGGGALFGGLDNRNLGVQVGPGNNGENRLSFFQFLDDDDDESNENTGIGP
jgi:ribosomal protein S27AE